MLQDPCSEYSSVVKVLDGSGINLWRQWQRGFEYPIFEFGYRFCLPSESEDLPGSQAESDRRNQNCTLSDGVEVIGSRWEYSVQ